MAKRHFEIFASLSIVALSLSGCGQAFDRYMQEGQKLRDHQDLAKAREKFHAAVLEARSEKKKSDHLLTALQAETECLETLKQYDDEAVLLDEEARTLEKANEFKRAAAVRKQIGDISMQAPNTSTAMQAYEDALADLKKIKAENSHYGAEILFAMGDVKVAQQDNNGALLLIQKGCAMMEKGNDSGNDPHTLAIGLHKLAAIYQQMNRDDDAIAADEKAKAIEIGGINTSIRRLPRP